MKNMVIEDITDKEVLEILRALKYYGVDDELYKKVYLARIKIL